MYNQFQEFSIVDDTAASPKQAGAPKTKCTPGPKKKKPITDNALIEKRFSKSPKLYDMCTVFEFIVEWFDQYCPSSCAPP
jgi:hypothetical protein